MKIGIYGGSFNPVHFGHVGLVQWVSEHTDLDEIWMLVSPNNPLKDSGTLADENVRLEAVRKAVESLPHVKVSDFEFSLPRPSYTANTLRALRQSFPDNDFSLIMGEDNLVILKRWCEWKYITSNYRIFVYPRANVFHKEKTKEEVKELIDTISREVKGSRIIYLQGAPYFDISSTEIRNGQRHE